MRIIELSANKASFKKVKFNPTGPSFILGSRKDKEHHSDDNKSYNGVGKSLLVEIVHFCLGANLNKSFKSHLPDWEFYLEAVVGGTTVLIRRSVEKSGVVFVDGNQLKLKDYNEYLERNCFTIPPFSGSQHLSFRSLIPRFIRRNKADYNDPRLTSGDKEPYTILLRNLFLLGIDIDLIERKCKLRTRQTELELFEKNFKNDPFIREYYTGNKDVTLQVKYLEDQAKKLEENLDSFQVAEDYYAIEKEANALAAQLKELKNKRAITQNSIHNIIKSLENRPDIPLNKVIKLYSELVESFKPETLKRLEEVEEFHNKLISNRISRLSQERRKIELELKSLEQEISEKGSEVDRKLAYLSDKRALDQYAAVSSNLSDVKAKLHKLLDYQQLLHRSREESSQVKKLLADEDLKTNAYLDETQKEREEKLSLFSEIAKLFYPDSPAGITLSNNSGDNKIRYDFDVRIEADGSDGINAVKLFCYDLAVVVMRHNHAVRLIWHDSRLFSDIDPRQRAVLFNTAVLFSKEFDFQYIATVNEDQLDAILPELTDAQQNEVLENIVLRLNDDGPEGKLLGIQVDMHY